MFWNRRVACLVSLALVSAGGNLFAQGTPKTTTQKRPVAQPAQATAPKTGTAPRTGSTTQSRTTQAAGSTTRSGTSKSNVVPVGGEREVRQAARPATREERPQGQPLRVGTTSQTAAPKPPIPEVEDPALNKILADWEQKSSELETLQCQFLKFRYNHQVGVEYRAKGYIVYKAPDHGVYYQEGSKITSEMVGRKTDAQGKALKTPYTLESDDNVRWISNGKLITAIDDVKKTYRRDEIPADMQGKNIVEGPLPFLFGMKADMAKKRYWLQLLKHDTEAGEIWIKVYPKTRMDAANYKSATVMLDDQTFLPKAVRMHDPAGTEEIVHTFVNAKVNAWDPLKFRDPFNPSLAGLKPVVNEQAPTRTAQADGVRPTSTTTPSRTAPTTGTRPSSTTTKAPAPRRNG